MPVSKNCLKIPCNFHHPFTKQGCFSKDENLSVCISETIQYLFYTHMSLQCLQYHVESHLLFSGPAYFLVIELLSLVDVRCVPLGCSVLFAYCCFTLKVFQAISLCKCVQCTFTSFEDVVNWYCNGSHHPCFTPVVI